ncbi:uncharacterized protein LOC134709429 [Mytilus trossulus]|uniref:uncharacterized protein LOC134709427 n=1 Tax=Mytilus trossulus TaxID=6551 RepID=UPI003007AA88
MTIHSDQVFGLPSTRASNLHICSGFIGNLTGDLQVQIQFAGNNTYQTIIPSYTTRVDTTENCELKRVLKFWIGFTVAMKNATIRCRGTNGLHPNDSPIFSKNETLYLVSSDSCKDNTVSQSYRVHPTNCQYYIECRNYIEPYGRACQYGYCFGIYTVETCTPCNSVICLETSSSCTNTTAVQQKKEVNMTIHSDQVFGLPSTRASNLHICSGFIGNLTGDLQVQIQFAGNNTYQTIIPSYTTRVDTTENCELKRVLKFWIGFTVAMKNATIRCRGTNGLHPNDSPIFSKNETLYLVSSDFCNQNFNSTKTNKYHHPTTCQRFISCVGNAPHVHTCSSGLCFSLEKDRCEYCEEVKTCP